MRKFIFVLLISVLMVSFAGVAAAAVKAEVKGAEAKASGVIKEIDMKKGTVVITQADTRKDVTLKADKTTLEKFKANDKVKVTYIKAKGGNTVKMLMKDRGAKIPVGC